MGFHEDVYKLAEQILQRRDLCRGNEEATKQALILPFLQQLGYDVWNPLELVPEYKAGWAANKEKVDYALFIDGRPTCFIEAKAVGEKLGNYDAQLAKYFNATPEIKMAIITDGVIYKFFTDSKNPNLLDNDPFFEFSLNSLSDLDLEILHHFRKNSFSVESVITQAENLVYLNGFLRKLKQIFSNPSDDFIRFIASDIFPSRLTANAVDRLRPLIQQAVSQTLVEMVSKGLSRSISDENTTPVDAAAASVPTVDESSKVVTTQEELDAYDCVLGMIASQFGDDHKINSKDTQSYFSIQIEKPSRWFLRLHFNNLKRKYVAFRIPQDAAQQIVHPDLLQPYVSSTTDGCSVTYENIASLEVIRPLIVEAYRLAQTSNNPAEKQPEA